MKVIYSKQSVKFLKKLDPTIQANLKKKIALLKRSLEKEGVIPFSEMDIKQLKGNWDGFYRLRFGKIRVIFKLSDQNESLLIYDIAFRGSAYKD